MGIDRVLSLIGTVLVPVVGLVLRSSRRNRTRKRIDEYHSLADQIAAHDATRAGELRSVAGELTDQLVENDRRAMHRRFQPEAAIALLFLVAPGIVVFLLALDWNSPAKWPAIIFSGLWSVVWFGVGLSQLFEHEGDGD